MRSRSPRSVIAVTLLSTVMVALTAACSATSDQVAPDSSPTTTNASAPSPSKAAPPSAPITATNTTTATTAETGPPAQQIEWQPVAGGEDCMCADGSDWNLWVREADPTKVMLYFQGGGACFNAAMCDFATSESYDRTVSADDDPTGYSGIFDFANPKNPVGDWSVVFVPYCTGDVHLGDATNDYGDGLVVEHNGMVNARFGMAELNRRFPGANEVFVTGSSAGGVPSPLFGGMAADLYPDARVTVLADGSGAYPSVPAINAFIGGLWGAFGARPAWPETAELTSEQWGIPDAFTYAGKHAPNVVMARHDHAFDQVQANFSALAGIDASELDVLITDNGAKVEAAGVTIADYLAPGSAHTILGKSDFYTQTVGGVALVDWVTSLLAGKPVDDVRCTTCN